MNTMTLETNSAYQNGTYRWLVKDSQQQIIATVLRSNVPFAKYRLIRLGQLTEEFSSKADLMEAIQLL